MNKTSNEYKRVRYEKGLCVTCNARRDSNKQQCLECREKMSQYCKARHTDRKSNNLCIDCAGNIEKTIVGLRCVNCWFRHLAVGCLGSKLYAKEVADLFYKQDGKCAYSDEPLIMGQTASLDHKVPISRNGTNDIENFHWVSKSINRTKGKMTHNEFVDFCSKVSDKYNRTSLGLQTLGNQSLEAASKLCLVAE